jgi:hypothetical protein
MSVIEEKIKNFQQKSIRFTKSPLELRLCEEIIELCKMAASSNKFQSHEIDQAIQNVKCTLSDFNLIRTMISWADYWRNKADKLAEIPNEFREKNFISEMLFYLINMNEAKKSRKLRKDLKNLYNEFKTKELLLIKSYKENVSK